jgi:hypothetical protein
MSDKINYREKVPCFGNQPQADIELLKKTAEADRRREALLDYLEEDANHIESMILTICMAVICGSLIAIGYFFHSIITQYLK